MFENKYSYKVIANYFNVNEATVMRTLHSLGLRRNNVVKKDYLLEHKDDMTNIEIAKHYNVDEATVTRAFQKYGIPRGKGCSNKLNPQNQSRK